MWHRRSQSIKTSSTALSIRFYNVPLSTHQLINWALIGQKVLLALQLHVLVTLVGRKNILWIFFIIFKPSPQKKLMKKKIWSMIFLSPKIAYSVFGSFYFQIFLILSGKHRAHQIMSVSYCVSRSITKRLPNYKFTIQFCGVTERRSRRILVLWVSHFFLLIFVLNNCPIFWTQVVIITLSFVFSPSIWTVKHSKKEKLSQTLPDWKCCWSCTAPGGRSILPLTLLPRFFRLSADSAHWSGDWSCVIVSFLPLVACNIFWHQI